MFPPLVTPGPSPSKDAEAHFARCRTPPPPQATRVAAARAEKEILQSMCFSSWEGHRYREPCHDRVRWHVAEVQPASVGGYVSRHEAVMVGT